MNYNLFATLYPFMTHDLQLRGAERDAFAVIFGFWAQSRKPVQVSLTTIQEISGATRPTIVAAILRLKKRGLLEIIKCRGKMNTYNIILPTNISWNSKKGQHRLSSAIKVSNDNNERTGNLHTL